MNHKEIFAVAGMNEWMTDEYCLGAFEESLKWHLEGDKKSGLTSYYIWRSSSPDKLNVGFTYAEIKRLVKPLDKSFWREKDGYIVVNQHVAHSLLQLMCNIQDQLNKHSDRLKTLIGTPSGRIFSSRVCK